MNLNRNAEYDFQSFDEAAKTFPLIKHTAQYRQHVSKVTSRRHFGNIFSNLRKRAMAQNPIAPNQADILPWILYDRNLTAAAANTAVQYTFYNQPIGAAGKTKNDTNLSQVSRLEDPQWFNCIGLGFYFSSDMIKLDLDRFLNLYRQEFTIGQKVYSEGPIQCFPAGAGLFGTTTRNNEGTFSNGQPNLGNVYDLRLPAGLHLGADRDTGQAIVADGLIGHTILQSQAFRIDLYGTAFALTAAAAPANGVGVNLMTYLYGILSRGVQ